MPLLSLSLPQYAKQMSRSCFLNSYFNGRGGAVLCDGVRLARITTWEALISASIIRFGSSDVPNNVAGFRQTIPSQLSGEGSFTFVIDDAFNQYENLTPGSCCKLVMVLNRTRNLFISFAVATITSTKLGVDVNQSSIVGGTMTFEGSGEILFVDPSVNIPKFPT